MIEILSLGICIACISCICCLCTATVITPGLIDLKTGLLLCDRQQCRRKSEEIIAPEEKKIVPSENESMNDASESETCPCAITYVLDPILQSRNTKQACGDFTKRRKSCRCPSFLDLFGDTEDSSGKILPRS